MDGALFTVEEIESNSEYSGVDTQEKIRNCIRRHYDNSRPMYLVLGGDEHIVPVRYCQLTTDGDLVPADLYYADMDGIRWDADGDGIYGEIDDVGLAELTPNICFGRIPVHTSEDVGNYLAKIFRYETIDSDEFVDSLLLLSGTGYGSCYEGPSRPPAYRDHEPVGRLEVAMTDAFLDIIQPYRQPGYFARFFDTNTEWDTDRFGDFQLTTDNFVEVLSYGFHYIYYWQHSNSRIWTFLDEDFESWFNWARVPKLENTFPSIIFARGCGTGYFDNGDEDKSMCEALIRHSDGGAIILFAHSRASGGSHHWDQILCNVFQEHHLRIGEAYQSCLTTLATEGLSNPWHQYIFVLLGDPALPIRHQHKKTLQLFSPKGNEIIRAGSDLTIRWNAAGDFSPQETVCLFYSDNDGASWKSVPEADFLPYNGGFFTWGNCPLPVGSNYKIGVRSTSDVTFYAESAKVFTLAELSELTVQSSPVGAILTGSINNQTNCTSSLILNTTVRLIVPQTMGERTFSRWTDENGDTLSGDNSLAFFFDHSTTITAEYQGNRSFYVNDSIAETGTAAGNDSADGRSSATPMRSINTLLEKYPDIGIGDVIYVSDGTYDTTLSLKPSHSGLIIEGKSTDSCILEGNGENTIIYLDGVKGISLRNLTMERGKRGIYVLMSDLRLENCVMANNSNGALWVIGDGSRVDVGTTRFTSNVNVRGGAIFLSDNPAKLILRNCLFENNLATFKGGAIFLTNAGPDTNVTIVNSTFFGNTAASSYAAILQNDTASEINLEIINNIFWENTAPKGNQISLFELATVNFNDIQGGYAGVGNMDKNPLFVRAGGWIDNGTPKDTEDDFWLRGDYHLKSRAGHWDSEHSDWIEDEVTSPCIDNGDPMFDWSEECYPNGERINMGAHGGTRQASMTAD